MEHFQKSKTDLLVNVASPVHALVHVHGSMASRSASATSIDWFYVNVWMPKFGSLANKNQISTVTRNSTLPPVPLVCCPPYRVTSSLECVGILSGFNSPCSCFNSLAEARLLIIFLPIKCQNKAACLAPTSIPLVQTL